MSIELQMLLNEAIDRELTLRDLADIIGSLQTYREESIWLKNRPDEEPEVFNRILRHREAQIYSRLKSYDLDYLPEELIK